MERGLDDLRKHSQSGAEQERIQELEAAHRQVTKLVREIFELLVKGALERAIQRVERELEQVAFTWQDEQIDRLRAYYDAAALQSMQRTRAVATQGELLAGVVDGGGVAADVPVYESETEALQAELNGAAGAGAHGGRPDAARVIVLMCHEDREGVFELLALLGARPVDVASELTELVPRLQGRPRRA